MINPFKKTYSSAQQQMFGFLEQVNLFKDLTWEEMSHFLSYFHERVYKQDEVVFFRGDPSQALYIVKEGKVCLNIDIKDKFEVLTELKRGQAFGLNSILKDKTRIYTAIVVSEEAMIYALPHDILFQIFDRYASIKAKMLNELADQYNQYFENLFKAYKSSFGFFELSEVYEGKR